MPGRAIREDDDSNCDIHRYGNTEADADAEDSPNAEAEPYAGTVAQPLTAKKGWRMCRIIWELGKWNRKRESQRH